jgi:AcrR family transcriptional regulator
MAQESGGRAREILDVATRLFARHGYEGVSVRDICSELSVNFSIISYYFGGKAGLYREVLRRQFAACADVFGQAAGQNLEPGEEVAALCRAMGAWQAENPAFSALLARESGESGPEFREAAREYEDRLGGRLTELIRAGQRQGRFKSSIRPESAAAVLGLLLTGAGTARTLSPGQARGTEEGYFDVIREVFLEGLLSEPEAGDAQRGGIGKNTAKPRGTFGR